MRQQQRGLGFIGLVLLIAGLVATAVLGMKLWPAYYEYTVIKRSLVSVAQAPANRGATTTELRKALGRQFEVDSTTVTSISAADVDVTKAGGSPVLSVSYAVKQQLFGNVSLCLQFDATSAPGK